MKLISPSGIEKRVRFPVFGTLCFGPLYFLWHGMMLEAVRFSVLAVFTVGLSLIVYPALSGRLVRKHHLRQGWHEVSDSERSSSPLFVASGVKGYSS